ncbi:hypothetical protein ACFVMC_20005 [Nocardia sp. NPDC127579]|uniref:hypothetical protein n=1 Tax=Nocardia sp. NPDC127579 TaxID=3345402 RepID=UPI00363FF50E
MRAVDHRGRLLTLLADPAQLPSARAPMPRYDATVVICDGHEVSQISLSGLDQTFSKINALGDGVILGAGRIDRVQPAISWVPSTPATRSSSY